MAGNDRQHQRQITNADISVDDAELMRAVKEDKRAFNRLMARYQGEVFKTAMRWTGDREASRDIQQEVFTAAWKEISGPCKINKLGPWLKQTTRYQSFRHWRRRPHETPDTDLVARWLDSAGLITQGGPASPHDIVARNEVNRHLYAELRTLSEELLRVLLYRFGSDMSAVEIAERECTSASTIRKRQQRALQRLSQSPNLRPPGGTEKTCFSPKKLYLALMTAVPTLWHQRRANADTIAQTPNTVRGISYSLCQVAVITVSLAVLTSLVALFLMTGSDLHTPEYGRAIDNRVRRTVRTSTAHSPPQKIAPQVWSTQDRPGLSSPPIAWLEYLAASHQLQSFELAVEKGEAQDIDADVPTLRLPWDVMRNQSITPGAIIRVNYDWLSADFRVETRSSAHYRHRSAAHIVLADRQLLDILPGDTVMLEPQPAAQVPMRSVFFTCLGHEEDSTVQYDTIRLYPRHMARLDLTDGDDVELVSENASVQVKVREYVVTQQRTGSAHGNCLFLLQKSRERLQISHGSPVMLAKDSVRSLHQGMRTTIW